MIKVERVANPKDRTCDNCSRALEQNHVRLTNDAGPLAVRVTDMCEYCALVFGVHLVQLSQQTIDSPEDSSL